MIRVNQSSSTLKYMQLVAEQYKGRRDGELCVICIRYETNEDGDPIVDPKTKRQKTSIREKWVSPHGDWDSVARWSRKLNRDRFNVYMSWALFKDQMRSKSTLIATAGFVADWDDQPRRELLRPTLEVRTSPGRQQDIFIHEPVSFKEALPVYRAAARALACDINTSGDPTHLWRVPGSMNWPRADKDREPSPSSWKKEDGPTVQLAQLAELAPERKADRLNESEQDADDWPERRTGKPVRRWVKEALEEDADIGERSEKFHRIVIAIAECGWGSLDIVDMMEKTDWAVEKFGARLGREVLRSISKALDDGKLKIPKERFAGGLDIVRFTDDFKERKISWLWYPYLPRGEVTLLDGDGGVGKTTMMLRVAFDAMTGGDMPNDYHMKGGAAVLYVSLEADANGVTMPVLKRMGLTSKSEFYHVRSVVELDEEGIEEIKKVIVEHEIDLVVIDSLVDYLPENTDMNDYKHASKMGLYLREKIAQPCNCTVVLMRHLTKGSKDKMRYRGMGSQGWHKGARSQLVVTESEEEEGCVVVVQTKSTYAKRGPSLLFGFKEIDGRGTVEWIGVTDEDEQSVTAAQGGGKKEDAKATKEDCIAWLRDYMSSGEPMWSNEVKDDAEKRGFSEPQLRRAAAELNIKHGPKVKMPSGPGTRTRWTLPD